MSQEQSVLMCPKASRCGRRPAWLNRELCLELRRKKRVHNLWKRGRATQEDYKDVARLCRDKVRKDKAHLELNLATAVKDNKKCFYKCVNTKRRTKETLHPLLDARGNLVTTDEEKTLKEAVVRWEQVCSPTCPVTGRGGMDSSWPGEV